MRAFLRPLPFTVCQRLGLPVGRRGDWFGYAFPNGLGWTLLALTDVVALYLLGSVASIAGTRAWRRRTRRHARLGQSGQSKLTGHLPGVDR